MDKYTDKSHPDYVPGTYSIYSSAMIRYMRKQSAQHYTDSMGDKAIRALTLESDVRYSYSYEKGRDLADIPVLKTRYGVILWPQPTNSPNDPFNWSTLRKSVQFIMLMVFTGLTAALTNNCSAASISVMVLTGISYDTINYAGGVLFVALGVSAWLYCPLEQLLGRKSVILISLLFSAVGCIWYATAQNDFDFYSSNALIGVGGGAIQAHVQLCLASIFFKHQLGAVITIYNLSNVIGLYLGPMIAKFIAADTDFRWVGWSGAIAAAGTVALVLFFFEESRFDYSRFKYRNDDYTLNISLMKYGILSRDENNDSFNLGYYDRPWGIWQRLAPFRLSNGQRKASLMGFIKAYGELITLPFGCLWFPPVVYAGIICGLQNALLTFYLTTEDNNLYKPPFDFNYRQVALMNIPSIIGAVVGALYAGSITDGFVLFMARKRGGEVESEFRLFFAFLSGTLGVAGLLMFGLGIEYDLDWRVYYVGLGLIAYMFTSSLNISMLYVLDTYPDLILETLVGVAFINNLIGCAFTFACSPWLNRAGTGKVYIVLAVICFFLMYGTIVFLYKGKSWRLATKRKYIQLVDIKTRRRY